MEPPPRPPKMGALHPRGREHLGTKEAGREALRAPQSRGGGCGSRWARGPLPGLRAVGPGAPKLRGGVGGAARRGAAVVPESGLGGAKHRGIPVRCAGASGPGHSHGPGAGAGGRGNPAHDRETGGCVGAGVPRRISYLRVLPPGPQRFRAVHSGFIASCFDAKRGSAWPPRAAVTSVSVALPRRADPHLHRGAPRGWAHPPDGLSPRHVEGPLAS